MASVAGEASSSSPPSSSIPQPRSYTYHVFLGFRGEDTRKRFTDHLHAALERKGIKTFRDDRCLETGEVISYQLLQAIEASMFAVIVLSPNYASSTWCLDELQKIVKCSKNMGLQVVPVFYGVEPSDVRRQKGSFEEAFKKHEKRFGQNSEKVRRWRDALAQVASLSGWDAKDQHEAILVECIAQDIHKKMIPKLPPCTRNLVGITSRVDEVMRHIGIGLNDVRFIGILGVGGIGQTTIARVVYEAIQGEFKVSCFVGNVREICERKDIVELQKKLVDRANKCPSTIDDENDGQIKIQSSLCNKKVLLVLDDVSNEVQLKNLARKQDWFGLGSRIIITTRDEQLLRIQGVHETYNVQCLLPNESFELFCFKAFKQIDPVEGYLGFSKEVVEWCGGLPLALEVLGSNLYGKPRNVWCDTIEKIKGTNPISKIHDRLKISYDGLDAMEKNIFLDIACFFKGKKIDYVKDVLERCGYRAQAGIDTLIDRSLVTINQVSNVLDMHDLVQAMGRIIVIQESPNDRGKRSRLWSKVDVDLVLSNNNGTEAIQGIALSGACDKASWSAEAFSNMTQLKLLKLPFATFPNGLSCLPTSLKVLHCFGFPLKTLPLSDQQYELVDIRLRYSYIEQVWHGKKLLGMLKHLNLSYSHQLKQTPDLSEVPILETLVLQHCQCLIEVHPSVVHHKNLILLDLTGCYHLKTPPYKLEMRSLNELILDDCGSFQNLPEFGECMKSLSRLSLRNTSLRELPISLGRLVSLEDLNLECCVKLEEDFADRHYMRTPGNRPWVLRELLSSINELPKLRCLKLNYWKQLSVLPKLPSSIRELELCYCDSLKISSRDNLSEVRRVFASPRQDPSQVLLEMLIPAKGKIPSWFVHQQYRNSVSIPCCDYPPSERLGIALCFQIKTFHRSSLTERPLELAVHNGNNRFITNRITPLYKEGNHLYIICLSKDNFSDRFHQGTCFELSILNKDVSSKVLVASAARWVSIEDI